MKKDKAMNYPNNECGECPVWLAVDENCGIGRGEAIDKYCSKCDLHNKYDNELDCDGRCLNCDYYEPITNECRREID